MPTKIIPEKRIASVSYKGQEVTHGSCEILCQQTFKWIHATGGDVPSDAVQVGTSAGKNPLFVGRVQLADGSHSIGKVYPKYKNCYIPVEGAEHAYSSYEVLILTED